MTWLNSGGGKCDGYNCDEMFKGDECPDDWEFDSAFTLERVRHWCPRCSGSCPTCKQPVCRCGSSWLHAKHLERWENLREWLDKSPVPVKIVDCIDDAEAMGYCQARQDTLAKMEELENADSGHQT